VLHGVRHQVADGTAFPNPLPDLRGRDGHGRNTQNMKDGVFIKRGRADCRVGLREGVGSRRGKKGPGGRGLGRAPEPKKLTGGPNGGPGTGRNPRGVSGKPRLNVYPFFYPPFKTGGGYGGGFLKNVLKNRFPRFLKKKKKTVLNGGGGTPPGGVFLPPPGGGVTPRVF